MSKLKKDVGIVVRKDSVVFRVWAPFASSVAVTGSFNNWGETPLESEQDGYWAAEVESAKPGQEYKYVIRNGEAVYYRNDPRALHMTTVVGNSVIDDPHFDWGDDTHVAIPLEKQVIYELHVGTFNRPEKGDIGTFQDVIDKLDYLADLGVNMIELMPIATMSMDRAWWGYTPLYIYAVEQLLGGRAEFMELVKAAHSRGIGIILDLVYNHLGPGNNLDLWQFDGWSQDGKGGIYFYNDWRSKTPWGDTRFDYGRFEVRQYILDNVRMWLHDCHIDGLRLDSTIFFRNAQGHNDDPSTDLPEGWQLMQHINNLARKINPAVTMIAEDIAYNHYITKPVSEGGAGFAVQWETNFTEALRHVLYTDDPTQINLDPICNELGRGYNGDAFQRVIYTDSHDSAANGSARLNEVIAPGKAEELFARKQSLIAAGLIFTLPGVPMLFQGEEFMQKGSFSDWQSLDWSKAERYSGITEAYRHLIDLRQNIHGNTNGLSGRCLNLLHRDDENKVIIYHRWSQGGPGDDVIVVINFGKRAFTDYAFHMPRPGTWQVRFNSTWKGYSDDFKNIPVQAITTNDQNEARVILPASSVLIFSQDD